MRLKYVLIFFLIASSAMFACDSIAQKSVDVSVEQFEKGITQKKVQLLDVRTPAEFKSGHLKNAILADWLDQKTFETKIATLNKSIPVYVYCHVGGRSSMAATLLKSKGFDVYNLKGGIVSWKEAGKLIE